MATTVSKFFEDEHIQTVGPILPLGTNSTEGQFRERTPAIQDGLVAHYELDGSNVGITEEQSISDDTQWVVGTNGTQGDWVLNGAVSENSIIMKENPWGVADAVWASPWNFGTGSDGDGGWNITNKTIDNTKTYRCSVWIRREDTNTTTEGRTYFGCQGSSVWNLGTTTVNTNPYFMSALYSDALSEWIDDWVLFVAHIHPHDYAGSKSTDSGIYDRAGNKVWNNSADFQWTDSTTQSGYRSYLFYSSLPTEKQFWYNPRMEIVDDYTSTLDDLLKQQYNIRYPVVDSGTSLNTYGTGFHYSTVDNQILNPTGSIGAGLPGSYTPGWDVTLHPTAFTITNWSVGYGAGVSNPEVGYHAQWVNEGPTGGVCAKMIDENTQFGEGSRWMGMSQSRGNVDTLWSLVSGLKTVTLSWDQKTDTLGKWINSGFYHLESAAWGFGNSLTDHYNTVVHQWQRMTKTYTINSSWDAGTGMSTYFYGDKGPDGTQWIANFQFEVEGLDAKNLNGDSANAFVDNALSISNSQLTLPIPVTTGNFTVNYWCKVLAASGSTPVSYGVDFCHGSYATDNSFCMMDDQATTPGGETTMRRQSSTGAVAYSSIFTTSSNFNNWNMYTVVRDATNYLIYLNAEYKTSIAHLSTTTQDHIILGSRGTTITIHPSIFNRVSIYNTDLDSSGVTSLYNQVSMKSNGDFIAEQFNEINPNIWPDPDLSTTAYNRTSGGLLTKETSISGGTYHQLVLSSSSGYRGYTMYSGATHGLPDRKGLEVGAFYIVSGEFWCSAGNTFSWRPIWIENAPYVSAPVTWASLATEEWHYVTAIFEADAEVNVFIYPANSSSVGTARWKNFSVQKALGAGSPPKGKPVQIMSTGDLYTRDLVED